MSAFRTWLQLFRAPNLLTVIGDPLAGYYLACFGAIEPALWLPLGASLCFYAGGLLLNDAADLREDRAERPSRPLPSGSARLGVVLIAMTALFGIALALCATVGKATLVTGAALLASIAAYNLFTKRIPILGALNMGACRGLSMLIGATAVRRGDLTYPMIVNGRLDHVIFAVGLVTLYIAAVTHLARFETRARVPVVARWLPGAAIALGGVPFILQIATHARLATGALLAVAFVNAMQVAMDLTAKPEAPVPPQIGTLIRLLLLIQAALCAPLSGLAGAIAAAVLVLLWPLSRVLSRWFYAS